MGPTRRSCHSTYSRPRGTSAAEETETSQRQSGPRGRPKQEPSTDHEHGSLRSSRDDDVRLPMVGEDAIPQMYDDAVPHAFEEGGSAHVRGGGKGFDFLCSLKTL